MSIQDQIYATYNTSQAIQLTFLIPIVATFLKSCYHLQDMDYGSKFSQFLANFLYYFGSVLVL